LSGFFTVGVGEVAVVQHFGKIVGDCKTPGLHYRLPYPFGRHQIVRPGEIRRVEVGFRTNAGASFAEPPANEWNVQHRGGRNERRPDEATVLAGDENLVDVNLVVHYRVADPRAALFRVGRSLPEGENKWDVLVRDVAEAGLREAMSRRPIETVLGSDRAAVETSIQERTSAAMGRYETGFVIESVCLADVHPPLEVVRAFREVTTALEEKEKKINDAQAYQYKEEARARGKAKEARLAAQADKYDRIQRAHGGADRFAAVADAYAQQPELARLRLYLQTMERLLVGRKKVILDRAPNGGRRQLFLGRFGVLGLMPPVTSETSPPGLETEGYSEP
jgi:HflK protein